MRSISALLLASTVFTQAQEADHPGKAIYGLYCIACHGAEGEGGTAPPIAGSEWVVGKPDRVIEIILNGLQGPLEVKGKSYNSLMAPWKAVLNDQQVADVASYVRGAWGNQEKPVTAKKVAEVRARGGGPRETFWKPNQLLKKYPLEKLGKIKDLISETYLSDGIKTLSDLRAAESINGEEEKDGIISLDQAALGNHGQDNFGMVWKGHLNAPVEGAYTFSFDTDDGGALTLNGREIITRDGVNKFGEPDQATVALKKGRNEIKVEYFEIRGDQKIQLEWSGPGYRTAPLTDHKISKKKKKKIFIPITPPDNEAVIYRNFIAGTDPRAIGVGYPEGVNAAFSSDSLSFDLFWKGKFMDGGRHWVERGQGAQKPSGTDLVKVNAGLPFARLSSRTEDWPKKAQKGFRTDFLGFELNERREPTFQYQIQGVKVADYLKPGTDGNSLTRTITFAGGVPAKGNSQVCFRALQDGSIRFQDGAYHLKDQLKVTIEAPTEPFLREKELLVPLLKAGDAQTITLTYSWK